MNIFLAILGIICFVIVAGLMYRAGFNSGYQKGIEDEIEKR